MTKLDDIILKLHYSANNRQFAKTERKGAEPVWETSNSDVRLIFPWTAGTFVSVLQCVDFTL